MMLSATCEQHPINPANRQNMECARLVDGFHGIQTYDCSKGDGGDGWTRCTRQPGIEPIDP